jgi:HPt (histidine-containing phosphotransfer) domain-containing protein
MDFPISTTPEQAIDAEALANLRVIGGDDPGFVEEMIVLFLEQAPRHLETIGRALAEGDLARITRAAHHVKSSSLYLGARRLSDLCARTEVQARAGNKNAVIDLITALQVEYEMVQLALRNQLGA